MRIIIAGPGRAGGALAIAADRAGHQVVALLARRPSEITVASLLDVPFAPWDEPLPGADLLVVAVRDDAIGEVAERLAPQVGEIAAAVHLSGLKSVAALEPLAAAGLEVGGFHPLQTLPDPLRGADALAGAHVAVTARGALLLELHALAQSLGLRVFELADEQKAVYHAAAAASSNYVVAALSVAARLFDAAGVDREVSRPLVEAVVANALDLGPERALTGPIARGDAGTVAAQVAAVRAAAPDVHAAFVALGRVTAELAGTGEQMSEALG